MDTYSILIISHIPVYKISEEDCYYSLDLWCKDVNANSKVVSKLAIFCPILESYGDDVIVTKLDSRIKVHKLNNLIYLKEFKEIISQYDVIQIGAGKPFWKYKYEFLAIIYARIQSKCFIYSISSNRVKLTLLNSEGGGSKEVKGRINSFSIYLTQKIFSKYSTGVLLVGNGLKLALGINNNNIHVGLASWIEKQDILPVSILDKKLSELPSYLLPELCVCTRLEKMKGVHLAIEALDSLKRKYDFKPRLKIYGIGPEKENLTILVNQLELQEQVSFMGVVRYGVDFFKEIRQYNLMLLTNLSDEQPRIIFDAISQGVLPICPNTNVYQSTGLDGGLLYKQGSAIELAERIKAFTDKTFFVNMINLSRPLLDNSTVEAMHTNRANWVKGLL